MGRSENGLVADVIPVLQMVVQNTDTIKAVAVAAAAAIGTKLVVQGAILAGTFTMAAACWCNGSHFN